MMSDCRATCLHLGRLRRSASLGLYAVSQFGFPATIRNSSGGLALRRARGRGTTGLWMRRRVVPHAYYAYISCSVFGLCLLSFVFCLLSLSLSLSLSSSYATVILGRRREESRAEEKRGSGSGSGADADADAGGGGRGLGNVEEDLLGGYGTAAGTSFD